MGSFSFKRARGRGLSFLRRKAGEPSDPPKTPAALAASRNDEAFRLNADIGRIDAFDSPRPYEEPVRQTGDLQLRDPVVRLENGLRCDGQSTAPSRDEERNGTPTVPTQTSAVSAEETQPAAARSPYQPLNPAQTEIRVLHIKAGRASEPLRCELRTVSLTAEPRPEYESISYCWGDPEPSEPILLNGIEICIPPNTKVVLERVRYPECDRVVWIDAVCINQKDEGEKQIQVGLMYEVYSFTTRNLVWLGDDTGDVAEAMAAIEEILADAQRETDDYRTFAKTVATRDTSNRKLLLKADPRPLLEFFQRRWFKRLWCVQEVVLPPLSVCYAGKSEVPLPDVMRAANWLVYKWYNVPFELENESGMINSMSIAPVLDLDARGTLAGVPRDMSLCWLLRRLQSFEATKPVDHVFGLLGMYRKLQRIEILPKLLRPDYSKSLAVVLRDASRCAVEETPSDITIFQYLNTYPSTQADPERLPSWVPRWHLPQFKTDHPTDLPAFFNAHDGTPASIYQAGDPPSYDPNVLRLKGITVDKVTIHSELIAGRPTILRHLPWVVGKSGQRRPAFWRTLMAGENVDDGRATEEEASEYMDWKWYFNRRTTPVARATLLHELRASGEVHSEAEWRAARYDTAALKHSKGRVLFRTSAGYTGLGPRTLRGDDVVAILHGCRWPVVLRPCEDDDNDEEASPPPPGGGGGGGGLGTQGRPRPEVPEEKVFGPRRPQPAGYHLTPRPGGYRILGVCYVDGIMDGEFVRKAREEQRQDMVFDLR